MLAGIDLGGTKIEGILLGAEGEELLRPRIPTPVNDYEAILLSIQSLHQQLEQAAGCQLNLGIGTPGSPSPATGLMRNANSTCLNGKPLHADLEQTLQRAVRMANDADCFALSEATDGVARKARSVFGVIIGTGTGAGIVIDGQLLYGANAIAGEWGHNPLPWPQADELPGPACYCGKCGCIETFLSGPGLSASHNKRTGKHCTPIELEQLAQTGDAEAEFSLQRYADRLARSLASIINVLDPEMIVLGGGVGQLQRLYTEVPALWNEYIFSDSCRTRLEMPQHGDSSGVRGAARLWQRPS